MNQDPIAQLIAIINNGQARLKFQVEADHSNHKEDILKLLERCGFISGYEVVSVTEVKKRLLITLSYFDGKPVISHLKRLSKVSRPVYAKHDDLPRVFGGMGIVIVSTSKGLMSDAEIRQWYVKKGEKLGGELIAEVA